MFRDVRECLDAGNRLHTLLASQKPSSKMENFEPTDAQRHNAETTLAQSRLNVVWVYRKVILGKDYEDSVRRTTIMKKKTKQKKKQTKKNKTKKKHIIVVKKNTTGE